MAPQPVSPGEMTPRAEDIVAGISVISESEKRKEESIAIQSIESRKRSD